MYHSFRKWPWFSLQSVMYRRCENRKAASVRVPEWNDKFRGEIVLRRDGLIRDDKRARRKKNRNLRVEQLVSPVISIMRRKTAVIDFSISFSQLELYSKRFPGKWLHCVGHSVAIFGIQCGVNESVQAEIRCISQLTNPLHIAAHHSDCNSVLFC